MVVLIDIDKKSVLLYGQNGLDIIPFSEISTLEDYIIDDDLYYITNAIEVETNDIINLVYKIDGVDLPDDFSTLDEKDKNLYLQITSDGTVYINEEIKFEGKYDLKILDEEMKEKIGNSIILSTLLKQGKIKIIGEKERRKLLRENRKEKRKIIEKQKESDARLDKIILDKPVAEFDGMEEEKDIIVSINMDGESDNIPIKTEVEENLKMIGNVPKE